MATCRERSFDALAVRVSRRTAVMSLGGGLMARVVRDQMSALARKNAGNDKDHTKNTHHGKQHGKKRPAKHDSGDTPVTPKIVGGDTVPPNKYPFQVALLDKRYGKKGFKKQFCGGSLIDANHVLTAAHCVAGRAKSDPKNLRVLVGATLLNSDQGVTREIATITVHPDYDGKTLRNDAAVLRLDAPVDLTADPAIRLATSGDEDLEAPGTLLTVTGWGSTRKHVAGKKKRNKPPKYSHGLREVQVPVVASDECNQDYGGKGDGGINAAVMICAGQNGRDSCWGDSGGPLFTETSGGFVQVGIASWGIGCAAPERPGVYTRVSALSSFIKHAIGG
jgi:secreted trypsin-like serine protease